MPAFEIDRYEVTNRQYLEFMAAGGYETRSFGATRIGNGKRRRQSPIPVSGARTKRESWLYRTMFEEIPLPLDWPVYVSHAEHRHTRVGQGKSLPTEEQWHRAAYGTRNEADQTVSVGR